MGLLRSIFILYMNIPYDSESFLIDFDFSQFWFDLLLFYVL